MTPRGGNALDILYIGDVPPMPAGSAISPYQILDGLARRGHHVRALGPITRETREHGLKFSPRRSVELHWFELPDYAWIRDPLPPQEIMQLERAALRGGAIPLLDAHRPDIVINGHEYWSEGIVPLVQAYELPSIQLVRGNPGRGIVQGTLPANDAVRVLAALRQGLTVVAVAEYLAEGLRRLGVSRAISIANVVDTERFCPRPKAPALLQELKIRPTDTIIAHFSNLKPIKRVLDIVESAPHILERCPNVVFLIAGEGLLRAEMEGRCRALGIGERFRFTGWVDYDFVPDYMNVADIVVMASSGEGMSAVYLEAQACGRVLVSSDIPPARQIVEPGVTGLLYAVGNLADLAEKCVMAVTDKALRTAIGVRARAQIELGHTLEHAATAYETVLLDAVARRRR